MTTCDLSYIQRHKLHLQSLHIMMNMTSAILRRCDQKREIRGRFPGYCHACGMLRSDADRVIRASKLPYLDFLCPGAVAALEVRITSPDAGPRQEQRSRCAKVWTHMTSWRRGHHQAQNQFKFIPKHRISKLPITEKRYFVLTRSQCWVQPSGWVYLTGKQRTQEQCWQEKREYWKRFWRQNSTYVVALKKMKWKSPHDQWICHKIEVSNHSTFFTNLSTE